MESVHDGKDQPIYHSTPLMSGSRSHQAGISLPSSQNKESLEITHQEIINLGTQVLPSAVDDFMVRLPDYATTRASLAVNEVITVMKLFGRVPQGSREAVMYIPLTAAIQKCLQGGTYTVWNSSSSSIPPLAHNALYKPDLMIAKQGAALPLTWPESRITGEVKPHIVDHAANFMSKDKSKRKADGAAVWTKEEYGDMAQMYHYASAQFQSRPQRGLFSFSVTGHFMRFWYWTPSGVAYTEGLDYLNREDVKTIMSFFRTWEAAEPCQRGEDVAPAGLEIWADDYTFQEVKVDSKYHVRWEEILEYLSLSFGSRFLTTPKKPRMVYWRFKHGPVKEPVEDPRAAVDYSKDAEDFDAKLPMLPQDYFFHVPAPGTMNKDPLEARTGILDPDQRCPHVPGDAVELVVIPFPVHKSPGLCSRATSCYAVLRPEVAFPEDPYEDIDPHTFWLHTLKLSWQHLNRVHELTWFVRLQGDDLAGRLRYIARALGGGVLTVAVEAIAPQGATPEVKKQVMDQNNRCRVLDFVILQEVGRPLQSYKSSRELTSVIFQGIGCLIPCLKAKVIHRDINFSNIGINIRTKDPECVLFDFDMAMDWPPRKDPQPVHWDISGLVGSRALGLYHPLVRHRPCHDLESFLWIFFQMITQYSPSVVICNQILADGIAFKDARRAVLFGFDDATPLNDGFEGKRKLVMEYLINSTVRPLSYALPRLLESMRKGFKALVEVQGWDKRVANLWGEDILRRQYEGELLEARDIAIQKRLSYSAVLAIFREALASEEWPAEDDAAMPFDAVPPSKPSPRIAEGHCASAQRSSRMSSVKRTYDQLKGEGGAAVEECSASKRRKGETVGVRLY